MMHRMSAPSAACRKQEISGEPYHAQQRQSATTSTSSIIPSPCAGKTRSPCKDKQTYLHADGAVLYNEALCRRQLRAQM